MIKNILTLLLLSFTMMLFAQKKTVRKKAPVKKNIVKKPTTPKINLDLVKINDSIPALIPFKKEGKSGFVNQKGKVIIAPVYSNVGFFTQDCNLLNSPKTHVRKFGSNQYASFRLNGEVFKFDQQGKRFYRFKDKN